MLIMCPDFDVVTAQTDQYVYCRSSVTRMSVDQKQSVIIQNIKEEAIQLEEHKKRSIKDEEVPEKKSESSTSEDSNSEADETGM